MKGFSMTNKGRLLLVAVSVSVAFSIVKFSQPPHLTKVAENDYSRTLQVSHVIDGDTIELAGGQIVRYIGIDTPETRKRDGTEWVYDPKPYAEEAKNFNRQLVEGKPVRLEFDVQQKDRYNRILAYVYRDGLMVNLEMLRRGYALIFTHPPNVRYMEEFLNAQKEAREARIGLWTDLEKNIISASEARENLGSIRMVETEVTDTFISERVLILNCPDNFNIVVFKDNLEYFPPMAIRSPDEYFRNKAVRVFGLIKDYKGNPEIVLYDSSQIKILD